MPEDSRRAAFALPDRTALPRCLRSLRAQRIVDASQRCGMKELAIQIIEDADTLAVLETGWWELWRRAPSATPFQSPAWLLPWWSSFSPGELFVVACRHAERLVGLAPFYIESGVQGRRILPIGISLSDYLDVLIDPQWEGPVAHAVVNEIARQRARWDSWALEELRPEAAALALACPDACCEKI